MGCLSDAQVYSLVSLPRLLLCLVTGPLPNAVTVWLITMRPKTYERHRTAILSAIKLMRPISMVQVYLPFENALAPVPSEELWGLLVVLFGKVRARRLHRLSIALAVAGLK